MTRLGIFGGTFDPPHNGHLLAAMDAVEALHLDAVWFVPNATQPLKGAGKGAPTERLEMVKLLVAGSPQFEVDAIEIERAGLSYTVDTVSAFAARFPGSRLFLLVGADVTASFAQWREPQRIRELAELVVLHREFNPTDQGVADRGAGDSGDVHGATWLPTRRIDISSTEVRQRVRDGKSIRGFVPDAVAEYIAAAGLYR